MIEENSQFSTSFFYTFLFCWYFKCRLFKGTSVKMMNKFLGNSQILLHQTTLYLLLNQPILLDT